MTNETRETLTNLYWQASAYIPDSYKPEYAYQRADRVLAALRDVLTPRTCSGCKSRHETTGACYKDVQDPEGEEVKNTRSPWNWRNRDTFGCNEWEPREGEGGAR